MRNKYARNENVRIEILSILEYIFGIHCISLNDRFIIIKNFLKKLYYNVSRWN